MKFRTLLGYLVALLSILIVTAIALRNRELLETPLSLGKDFTVPVYAAGVLIFLLGFLPPAGVLLAQTLRRDLAERQARRSNRESVSLDQVFRRAVDYQADSQFGKALEQMELYVAERPDDFSGLQRHGQLLRQLGRPQEALEVHRRAAEKFPGSVAILYELIEDYEEARQPEIAAELRNRIVRDFPGHCVQIRRHHRQAAIARQDWKTAAADQDEIDALLAGGADEQAAHRDLLTRRGLIYQRGVALLEADRAFDAADIFRGLLNEEQQFIPARIMLGEALLLMDDEASAVAEWRRGFDTTGSPVFLQRIEDYFIELEEPMRAIETLRGVIASSKKDILPRFFLGRLYYRLEMHDEAEKILLKLKERLESSPTYQYLLGRMSDRRGEMGRAAKAYLECAHLLGVRDARYRCRTCGSSTPDWRDRCDDCGSWNSVELSLDQESLDANELGLREVPIWGGNNGFI